MKILSDYSFEELKQELSELPAFRCRQIFDAIIQAKDYDSLNLPKQLIEKLKVEYILKPDRSLEEKIVVMPIMLAKGLEFDVVIIWDDRTEEYWEKYKTLKYLMCTRALHELYIVTDEKNV